MKKTTTTSALLLFLVLAFSIKSTAQNEMEGPLLKNANELTYKALVSYNVDEMLGAKKAFDTILKNDSINAAALYGLTFSEYKLLEMSMRGENSKELFDSYYQKAIDDAEKLSENEKHSSEGKSLLAAVYMMKIATSPMSAVALSPKIYGLLGEAQRANPDNPETYVILGQMKFNTPAMFGGSVKDAVKMFSKAEALFEQGEDSDMVNVKWGKIESLAWMGRSFHKLNNHDAAKFAYQKALSIEPNFGWVKHQLLPALEAAADSTESK